MVYVISKDRQPIMPTTRYGKIRRLLKEGKAKVVKRCPFTIQLLYESTTNIQPISLGIDAGSKTIGLSATTDKTVLYESEVTLRSNIVGLIATRRENRHSRRHRKTRYRKARFNNRRRNEGWLAPSVKQKIDTHLKVIENINKMLPISKTVIEVASFDIQKIKNPNIQGAEYQQGEQLDFWNVREYVLWRDNHTCQCCKGNSGDKILNVHHVESRKTGGNAPNDLVTLCETCHKSYHLGKIELPQNIRRGKSFRDAAFMGIMRWAFYNELKNTYDNVYLTYGYITKNIRINTGLDKTHYIDARCISGNPNAKPPKEVFYQKKIRCHNRQIHKMTINKSGIRKLNQAPYEVKGFRLFDVVKVKGNYYYVHGRRIKGAFVLKTLTGNTLEIIPTKIKRIVSQQSFITERRSAS